MAEEVRKDPWEARLKPISSDSCTRGGLPGWLVRAYDASDNYEDPKTKGVINYGTVVVRSLWWPGSFTFYNSGRVQQIYVGDGLKHELPTCTYYPVNPPVMM